MDFASISIIVATLLGPILAVQAQKAVERARDRHNRKSWIFHNLMATRAARVSADHVQALNMIDLVFYGRRILGIHRRSKAEAAVLDAWHEYLDHLNTKYEQESFALWVTKGDELFVNLLFALAVDVGYRFDRVQLKKGAYSPIAHGELEFEQQRIRKLAIELLSGVHPLKWRLPGFPSTRQRSSLNWSYKQNWLPRLTVEAASRSKWFRNLVPNPALQGTRKQPRAPELLRWRTVEEMHSWRKGIRHGLA